MIALVGIGGCCGAMTRYSLGKKLGHVSEHEVTWFPLNTFIINVTGALLLGLVSQLYHQGTISFALWSLLGTGFLGAYTTFSTFSVEAGTLFLNKHYKTGVSYVVWSLIIGVLGAWLGTKLGLKISR